MNKWQNIETDQPDSKKKQLLEMHFITVKIVKIKTTTAKNPQWKALMNKMWLDTNEKRIGE